MKLRQSTDTQYRYTQSVSGARRGNGVPPKGMKWTARRIRIDYLVTMTATGGVYVQPAHRKQNVVRLDQTFPTVEKAEQELANLGYTHIERNQ